jgi:hypothetical protein
MEAIASLARQANKSQAACSSTDTSDSDGSDDSGIVAILRSDHVPPALPLAAATNEQDDSDFQVEGASAVITVEQFECMIKMANAYKTFTANGEDCHVASLHVYTTHTPHGVRAHKRITDEIKILFQQLFQRIGGTSTDPGQVVDLIYTVSSTAAGPRWRPVDTPSKCSFSGAPADVQFQVDIDVYKTYAQWSRATRVTSTLPHVPYAK